MNLLRKLADHAKCALMLASFAAAIAFGPGTLAAEEPLLEVKRFIVEGDNPLSETETQAVLKPHLGPHTRLATLEAAAISLQEAIRNKGYSFHRVIVPAQQPRAGELTLRVLPFVLDHITVTGNEHFSTENIRRSMPGLKAGRAPNVGVLAQQLGLANEHASKRIALQVKEGTKPGTVDADLRVADVKPGQFFVGLTGGTRDFDNTLNRNTGYTRLTLGYQHSNLFDRDHTLTAAYTTSPEYISRVTQIGAFYTIPFYGYNTMVSAYFTYSDVNSGTVGIGAQSFDVSGSGEFYGIKATYLLPRLADLVHNVSIALDERYFESEVAFLGAPLPASTVGSRPITVRYAGRVEQEQTTLSGYAEYALNLAGGRSNGDVSYAASRAGAERDWEAYRYGLDGTYRLDPRWAFNARFRGQYAHEPLIPGEQLGINGSSAVRGFREREITGDKGYYVNLEAHGPPLLTDFAPFLFYDFGARSHVTPVIGSSPREHIASSGAGLRWRWQRIDMNVTWGHVLNGAAGGTPRDHDKLNFSAFYRF